MKTYGDVNVTLAIAHTEELRHDAEHIRLLREAHANQGHDKESHPGLINRIGAALVSGGKWLIDHNRETHE